MSTRKRVVICNLLCVLASAGVVFSMAASRSYSWQAQVHKENVFSGTAQTTQPTTAPTTVSTTASATSAPTTPTDASTATVTTSADSTNSTTGGTTTDPTTVTRVDTTRPTWTSAAPRPTQPLQPGSPETGDPGNMALWFVLMIASAIAMRWVINQIGPSRKRSA